MEFCYMSFNYSQFSRNISNDEITCFLIFCSESTVAATLVIAKEFVKHPIQLTAIVPHSKLTNL